MIPTLLRTRSAAEALLRRAASHVSPDQTTSCLVAPSALALPSPGPLVVELVALGVDKSSATRISSIFLQFASRLQTICESDYRRRCQSQEVRHHFFQDAKSATLMSSAYLAIYTQRLTSWKSYLVDDVTPRVLAAQGRWQVDRGSLFDSEPSPLPKRPFNQDAVPVLERFFDTNAFPSRLEKLELATRCDMEYKQIHVWFQNRRSRFRKEGKVLRKQGVNNGVLKQLENRVVEVLLPEQHGNEQGDIDSANVGESSGLLPPVESETKDILDHDAPPHAFPAPYPPACPYEPFPIANGKQQVFALPWLRKCDSQSRFAEHVADVTDLTTAFSLLSLGDLSRRRSQHTNPHLSNSDPLRFSFGFATPCSRAPHPALVRKSRRLSRGPCEQPCSSYRARSAYLKPQAVETSSQALHPTAPSAPLTRAKRALPRRIPKHPPASRPSQSVYRPGSATLSRASSICSSSSSLSDVDTSLLTPSPVIPELPLLFTPVSPVPSFSGQGLNTNAFVYADALWSLEKTLPDTAGSDILNLPGLVASIS